MQLQEGGDGFRFATRTQAVRDRPWKDWGGIAFSQARAGPSCCLLCARCCRAAGSAGPPCCWYGSWVRTQQPRERPPCPLPAWLRLQGDRYSLRQFQERACENAAKRFGGLHGCLPARTIEVGGGPCQEGLMREGEGRSLRLALCPLFDKAKSCSAPPHTLPACLPPAHPSPL